MPPATAIALERVSRLYKEARALDGIDLEVRAGEFFSLLGPSGSGKTTCLRLIGGFDTPSAGTIRLFGEDVTARPPFDRDVNTVFQDYALFPHMSVVDNVAYSLMIRGVARGERTARATEMLGQVQLAGMERRMPSQLSGGQRQRVALARALVASPKVLLLDEPLGALDRQLRERVQRELKALQQRIGITFVFVTHDQGEALAMSDRVAVFNRGKIEQIATPSEIYERPATRFVAEFVGTTTILEGAAAEALLGAPGAYAIRPERVALTEREPAPAEGVVAAAGVLREATFLGSHHRCDVELDGPQLDGARVVAAAGAAPAAGARVWVSFPRDAAHALAADPGGGG